MEFGGTSGNYAPLFSEHAVVEECDINLFSSQIFEESTRLLQNSSIRDSVLNVNSHDQLENLQISSTDIINFHFDIFAVILGRIKLFNNKNCGVLTFILQTLYEKNDEILEHYLFKRVFKTLAANKIKLELYEKHFRDHNIRYVMNKRNLITLEMELAEPYRLVHDLSVMTSNSAWDCLDYIGVIKESPVQAAALFRVTNMAINYQFMLTTNFEAIRVIHGKPHY